MSEPLFVATWSFGQDAVRQALAHYGREPDLEHAAVAGTAAVELDPDIPTVGIGGLPNREGVMELDAGFMRGSDLACGAVAAVRAACPAIEVAHRVANDIEPVMLAGAGADAFALDTGSPPRDLLTEQTREAYADWRAGVHAGEVEIDQMVGHDTLGLLGWEAGRAVACVATSGLGFKRPGRVGDSPIIGAGFYADDEAGCVACTGRGEDIWRHALAIRVIDAMARGLTPDHAGAEVLGGVVRRFPQLQAKGMSLIAIRQDGAVGSATTRTDAHLFEYFVGQGESIQRVVPEPIA
ncbi:MAG: isoaspartyl peptidase/L-asparaginase [Planctomycetota bacterium]